MFPQMCFHSGYTSMRHSASAANVLLTCSKAVLEEIPDVVIPGRVFLHALNVYYTAVGIDAPFKPDCVKKLK